MELPENCYGLKVSELVKVKQNLISIVSSKDEKASSRTDAAKMVIQMLDQVLKYSTIEYSMTGIEPEPEQDDPFLRLVRVGA